MNPCIELVFNEKGILVDCYALHEQTGGRVARLFVMDSEEHIKVSEPSVTEFSVHSMRVKRTVK